MDAGNDLVNVVETIEDAQVRLHRLGVDPPELELAAPEKAVVMFCGPVNAGKSSLLNRLVENDVLPTGRLVADTRRFARLGHRSTQSDATVVEKDGTSRPISLADAAKVLSRHDGNELAANGVERVDIAVDAPWLGEVELEDSPGRDEAETDAEKAGHQLLEHALDSAAVVYVVSADGLLVQSDAAFLQRLLAQRIPVRLVISWADVIDEAEEDLDPIEFALESVRRWELPISAERIHPTSTLTPTDSGIDGLRDVLQQDFNGAEHLRRQQHARRLRTALAELQRVISEGELLLDERAIAFEEEAIRSELRKTSRRTRQVEQAAVVFQRELYAAVDAAADAAARSALAAEQREQLDDAVIREVTERITKAVAMFNDSIGPLVESLELAWQPLEPQHLPNVVLPKMATDDATPELKSILPEIVERAGETVAKLSREVRRRRHADAVHNAVRSALDPLVNRYADRAESRLESIQYALEDTAAKDADVRRTELRSKQVELRELQRKLRRQDTMLTRVVNAYAR